MNTPSIKTLMSMTRCDVESAKLVKYALTHSADEVLASGKFPDTERFERQCHHRPSDAHIMIVACDEALRTYGVECVTGRGGRLLEYCNTGDSYAPTLCFEFRGGVFGGRRLKRVWVGSWGDWVEKWGDDSWQE